MIHVVKETVFKDGEKNTPDKIIKPREEGVLDGKFPLPPWGSRQRQYPDGLLIKDGEWKDSVAIIGGPNKTDIPPPWQQGRGKLDLLQGGTWEGKEIGGGAYKDLPSREGKEKHHIPANSASDLPTGDGPAISMNKEEHRQTASCGNSKEAQEYRAEQKKLIEEGKFKEAQQMDIDDIREKFGGKYDDQIAQMEKNTDPLLEKQG